MIVIIYCLLISVSLLVFSYLWIDDAVVYLLASSKGIFANLLFLSQFSNQNRNLLATLFLILLTALFCFQLIISSKLGNAVSTKNLLILSSLTTFIFSICYPFLSNDLFLYIFYARMVIVHHVNPYLVAPREFWNVDLWVSLIRNLDVKYLYGPGFLVYSVLLMILASPDKLILNFYLFKLINGILFFLAGLLIYRLNPTKQVFALWFFNPLLIFEFLINSHNDLLMVSLSVIATYSWIREQKVKAWLAFWFSFLIKYFSLLTLPSFYMDENLRNRYFKLLSAAIPMYLLLKSGQVWYFTWAYMFLPFITLKKASWTMIYLVGLLLSERYYSFILTNGWGEDRLIPYSKIIIIGLIILAVLNELGVLSKIIVNKRLFGLSR